MWNGKLSGFFDGCEQEPSHSPPSYGLTFTEYQESYALRRAAERAVQIISEAKALPAELLDRHPTMPWTAIIRIGNILRHEYQRIEDQRIWEIVTVHLPQLRPVIMTMLAELDR